MIKKISLLRKKHRKDKNRTEWALLSRSKPHKVLKWFGTNKPSEEQVKEEEKRIQYFKHLGENVVREMNFVSNELRIKGIPHIADAVSNCAFFVLNNLSLNDNVIRLGKIINLLQKKGESNLSERLDTLLPDILACNDKKINSLIEVNESEPKVKISALRAYNIAKLLNKKYLEGELDSSDFEYSKMKELETLLKTGFIMPTPITYEKIPEDSNNWWDHFERKYG